MNGIKFKNQRSIRRGFILYVVLTVMLALAILAFGLNSLKSGAITQLAKNIDQNRLTLLATSANNEFLATIRTEVNHKGSEVYNNFRKLFPYNGTLPASPIYQIQILPSFQPSETLKMATDIGYKLKIKSKTILSVYRECPYKSVTSFNGYLDIYSQAYREGSKENIIEVHERRDIRLTDLRHRLDKYVLFVKNYCPDYNNTSRRLSISGVSGVAPEDKSKVFLGTDNYVNCTDPDKKIWLDISMSESSNMPGFAQLFNKPALSLTSASMQSFPSSASGNKPLFIPNFDIVFSKLKGITVSQFISVPTIKRIYEKFVNEAANGCNGSVLPYQIGAALKTKAANAMKKSNSNAASYKVCDDFQKNANGEDYSSCLVFKDILNECVSHWHYHFGYTDAENIWNVNTAVKPTLPTPKAWVNSLAYCGLASTTAEFRNKGSYFAEYLGTSATKYNPERAHVGKMSLFFGEDGNLPVLFEGDVFLRFFKIAYLDNFTTTIDFGLGARDLSPEPIPLPFMRVDKPKTFLNSEISGATLSPKPSLYGKNYLMSRAIDNIRANCLLGNAVSYYNGDGNPETYNPFNSKYTSHPNPVQKAGSSVPGKKFGRLIDFESISYNYSSPAKFLAERVKTHEGKKTLFVDGVMYVEKGDLDLSQINYFYGSGLIYLSQGNCLIGDFIGCRDKNTYGDSVRFYLRQGDFIIKSSSQNVTIEASLAAFNTINSLSTLPTVSAKDQGSLICAGKQNVTIFGNLLVDYLYTQGKSNSGLIPNGTLSIFHNPLIYDPDNANNNGQGSVHVSISPVKSLYSISAAGATF